MSSLFVHEKAAARMMHRAQHEKDSSLDEKRDKATLGLGSSRAQGLCERSARQEEKHRQPTKDSVSFCLAKVTLGWVST